MPSGFVFKLALRRACRESSLATLTMLGEEIDHLVDLLQRN
jgi:hypothetical protein